MNSILALDGIFKSFGKEKILTGASFKLKPAEAVALTGPSGSGKSTLLYICGLLDSADDGVVEINGQKAGHGNDNARARLRLENIGFVYQQHNLFPDFTTLENVMIPLLIAGRTKLDAAATAREYLHILGIAHRENNKPAELSGGEAQRAAIARALVLGPKILLADEPTGNLDPKNSEMVFNLLLSLVRKEGMAAIVATHNPALANTLDRQISIDSGRIK